MEERFNDIYDKTYHTITRYVISKCDNLCNVEEIVQDVYLKLYKLLNKNYAIQDYQSFLLKLAKNELFKYYKIKNKFKIIFNKDIDNCRDKLIKRKKEYIDKIYYYQKHYQEYKKWAKFYN